MALWWGLSHGQSWGLFLSSYFYCKSCVGTRGLQAAHVLWSIDVHWRYWTRPSRDRSEIFHLLDPVELYFGDLVLLHCDMGHFPSTKNLQEVFKRSASHSGESGVVQFAFALKRSWKAYIFIKLPWLLPVKSLFFGVTMVISISHSPR